MAQRHSEYPRQPNELYVTPGWVWDKLYTVEPWARQAFDCAPISPRFDFLDSEYLPPTDFLATNPPFNKAEAFVRKALSVAEKSAFLLLNGFDTAKRRVDLFTQHPFKTKYVLTQRIRWDNLEQQQNGPSTNHAWYVWDDSYMGEPKIWWI